MKPTTFLTAGEAARLTGKSVPTITRAIKSGRILGGVSKGDKGEYQIDPSALFDVYPMVKEAQEGHSNLNHNVQGNVTHLLDTAYTATIEALKETIAAKDAQLSDKEKTIEDYRTRLAKSENLLTGQQAKAEATPEKKGFLARLFG